MVHLKWEYPRRPGKRDKLYQKIVRENKGIGDRTIREAELIGAIARARLAPHSANAATNRRPGDSPTYITVDRGSRRVDAFVNMHDPDGAALVIEGKFKILRGAIGRG